MSCLIATMLFATPMHCQEQPTATDNIAAAITPVSPVQVAQITEDMMGYIGQVAEIQDRIPTTRRDGIADLQNMMLSIDVQWQAYTQIIQVEITESPTLMELLSEYKVVYSATNDSITAHQQRLDAADTYDQSLAFLTECKKEYDMMVSEAHKFALVPQTASQLAEVKAREALLFAQVTEHYQKALAASQQSEDVKQKMPTLQQTFIDINKQSETIKSAAYKPWIERIKDYVLTFAGVAIILIFFNFVITKIKAVKQARDMAKKYGDMLNSGNDYPTI